MAAVTTPTPLSQTPTASLPLSVVRAVTRYEVASVRRDELAAKPASEWTPAEFDSFTAVHDAIVESVLTLGAADRLDLIAPAETAARYRQASAHCRELAASGKYVACLPLQDEMRMCLCQLQAAGRLDLIGAAS